SRTPKPTGAWCWRAATDADIGSPTRRGAACSAPHRDEEDTRETSQAYTGHRGAADPSPDGPARRARAVRTTHDPPTTGPGHVVRLRRGPWAQDRGAGRGSSEGRAVHDPRQVSAGHDDETALSSRVADGHRDLRHVVGGRRGDVRPGRDDAPRGGQVRDPLSEENS